MGQYHILVNLDKKEVVVPHGLGLGLKQREHVGSFAGSLSDALYVLQMTSPARGGGDFEQVPSSGRWAGDRVVVLGDYTEDSDLPSVPNAGSLYGQISASLYDIDFDSDWTDITDQVATDTGHLFRFRVSDSEYGGWKKRVDA